jgi:O-antigen/teichoic acid export membrane protein
LSSVTPEFIDVILGERWSSVILPLQLIALVAPLRMLATLFATAVSAIGRADVELVNTLVSLAVSAVAFVVGVRWGVSGLAVAYVAAVATSFFVTFPRTARVIGISLREIGAVCRSCLISGTAMIAAVAGVRLGLEGAPNWARLPLLVVVGIVVYAGALFAIDRSAWVDARRVAAALRGSA